MERRRPTAVTVVAVLSLVLGGLGLVCSLCGTAGAAFFVIGYNNAPPPKPGEPDGMALFKIADEEMPNYKYVAGASLVFGIVMAAVLIVAGIGLLRMSPFARTLTIFFAVVWLLYTFASLAYQFAVVRPGAQEAIRKWVEHEKARGLVMSRPQEESPLTSAIGPAIGTFLSVGFAATLLIVMMLPGVKRAFRPDRFGDDYSRDDDRREPDDYDDRRRREPDDYDDRRRPDDY
jgi:hypothetical protein